MAQRDAGEVTALLERWAQGDRGALDALVPLVYQELRRVARARLRGERGPHALETTALVHEVYLRLAHIDAMPVGNRTHFLALAARLMRQVLVDEARRRRAGKRGGGATLLTLNAATPDLSADPVDVLALDAALAELGRIEERLCRTVELKFFAGMTNVETAAALNVSPVTIERDWAFAKAWLYERLSTRS